MDAADVAAEREPPEPERAVGYFRSVEAVGAVFMAVQYAHKKFFVPALAPLTTGDAAAHALSGLTLEAELVLRRGEGGRELCRGSGSFLFTHFGCSGPAPLNLSRHFLRARAGGPAWGGSNLAASRLATASDSPSVTLPACNTR